ncbi:hypothetical protein AGDE_16793 [Angomonas deanei]|uniref:Leucine Rich repeat n=1 Tax=Angomonas deanei TaxID=59799 RepID=A0A7G2CDG0_9TRYP|nr:hypothetical protein AGDE_16793 [Angomonas deanei]CAD2217878.1 hypothetical protein, conserved [Angomonas deanei]|eukprot:EPY16188.1 hypothetical protein AGDE_16793 [Angomonas deanei]
MSFLQDISQYMDYFEESPPLALAAVNSRAREYGERHEKGILRCNVTSGDDGLRRVVYAHSSDVASLKRVQWWVKRQREYPVQIVVEFNGTESLADIPIWETLSQQLCKSKVEHLFHVRIKKVQSLLPFAVLLKRSDGVLLDRCTLTTLEALGRLGRLRRVDLSSCDGAFTLDPLSTCPNLTSVSVEYSHDVTSPEALWKLQNLKHVVLRGCGITSVAFLSGCTSLESVNVCSSRNLNSLVGLSGLKNLQIVNASHSGIESIECLTGCLSLQLLDVSCCKSLTSLEGLSGLQNLREVLASYSTLMILAD